VKYLLLKAGKSLGADHCLFSLTIYLQAFHFAKYLRIIKAQIHSATYSSKIYDKIKFAKLDLQNFTWLKDAFEPEAEFMNVQFL
jgi:hypothetical protein